MNSEEILEGRGMRIRRDDSSTEEVERAHVKGTKGANGGHHTSTSFRNKCSSSILGHSMSAGEGSGGPGEEIWTPPKVVHTFHAETESTYTVSPALRVEEFSRDLFALPTDRRGNPRVGGAVRLMRAYPDEFL
jgi:hypothetical protein